MKEKEAKQIIESEFGDLKKEDRSQYDTLVALLVKYGADNSRPMDAEVKVNFAEKDLANEVKEDIENRIIKGVATYGERLKPFNGRIALQDAYEEILDLALYIKQELKERDSKISA